MSFENIRVVLVNTKHAGNIGSAARAMKTMGLSCLHLVEPVAQFPSEEATTLASGATDILANTKVAKTLNEAVEDCVFVVGVSARVRGISLPIYSPADSVTQILNESHLNTVALVFGREDRGLTNEELRLCHHQVFIPAVDDFKSLNLASAVQVLAYELRKTSLDKAKESLIPPDVKGYALADTMQMEHFYNHLHRILEKVDFFLHSNPEKMMSKIRKIYGRVRPDQAEMNILRGILTEIEKKLE